MSSVFRLTGGTFRDGVGKKYVAGDKVESDEDLDEKFPGQFERLSGRPNTDRKGFGRTKLEAKQGEHGWEVINEASGRKLNDLPLTEEQARSFMDDFGGAAKRFFHCPPIWRGTCFIIGGGPSLKGFKWQLLKGQRVIGCNDAYQLGSWVDVMHYGDEGWFDNWYKKKIGRESLRKFPGLKTCSCVSHLHIPDVKVFRRLNHGIEGIESRWELAWNQSTGAQAINLAILLGARRIILLGFDMKPEGEDNNWHSNSIHKANPDVNARHLRYIKTFLMPGLLKLKEHPLYKDLEVLNVKTDPESPLDCFPETNLKDELGISTKKAEAKTEPKKKSRRTK